MDLWHTLFWVVNINLANENPYYSDKRHYVVILTLRKQYENKLFKIIGKIKQSKRLHGFFWLKPVKYSWNTSKRQKVEKKGKEIFGRINKKYYLCHRYPENNLFTLKETNTYWRFGAVACEGHRFFFCSKFSTIPYHKLPYIHSIIYTFI